MSAFRMFGIGAVALLCLSLVGPDAGAATRTETDETVSVGLPAADGLASSATSQAGVLGEGSAGPSDAAVASPASPDASPTLICTVILDVTICCIPPWGCVAF